MLDSCGPLHTINSWHSPNPLIVADSSKNLHRGFRSEFSLCFIQQHSGANQRLHVAAIGAGGKGGVDIGYCDQENVVALCDADTRQAAGSQKKFAKARLYQDFRVMLEKEQHRIDAVTISTPDHTHAHPAVMAMRLGKHVIARNPDPHRRRSSPADTGGS